MLFFHVFPSLENGLTEFYDFARTGGHPARSKLAP